MISEPAAETWAKKVGERVDNIDAHLPLGTFIWREDVTDDRCY